MAFVWTLNLPIGKTVVAVRYVKAISIKDNTVTIFMIDGTTFVTTGTEKELNSLLNDFKSHPTP
jgi:hypothetical protein